MDRIVRYTRRGVLEGLKEGVPFAIGVVPWAVAFGVAAQSVLTPTQGLVMSAYLYSGTAQFVALGLWHAPFAVISMLLAVFAVNARYLLQGMTLAPWLSPLPAWQRWGTLFFLIDGTWATSLRRFESGYDDVGFLLGNSILPYLAWFIGTAVGFMFPIRAADIETWGLDFAVTAAVVALAGGRWTGRSSVLPWVVTGVVAYVSWRLIGGNAFIFIGGIAGALAGAFIDARAQDKPVERPE